MKKEEVMAEKRKEKQKCIRWGTIVFFFIVVGGFLQIVHFREKIVDFLIFLAADQNAGGRVTLLSALGSLLPITFFYFLWRPSFVRVIHMYADDGTIDPYPIALVVPRKELCVFRALWLFCCTFSIWKANSLLVLWFNGRSFWISVSVMLLTNFCFFVIEGGVCEWIASFKDKTVEDAYQDQVRLTTELNEKRVANDSSAKFYQLFLLCALCIMLSAMLFLLMPYTFSDKMGGFSLAICICWSVFLGVPTVTSFLMSLILVFLKNYEHIHIGLVICKFISSAVVRVWLVFGWMRAAEIFCDLWLVILIFVILLLALPIKTVFDFVCGVNENDRIYQLAFPLDSLPESSYHNRDKLFFQKVERIKEVYPFPRNIFVFMRKILKNKRS